MPRWAKLAAVWLIAALGLGGALTAADRHRGPLDDPDLAYQRPGFLDAHHGPSPAPAVAEGVPAPGERTVVFFTRPERLAQLVAALPGPTSLAERTRIAVVVAGVAPADGATTFPIVADPDGRLAAAFMLDRPRDGGPPVGYAIVDRRGQIRYRTLDPEVEKRLDEVETMVRATP